jgi:hypothetical protein
MRRNLLAKSLGTEECRRHARRPVCDALICSAAMLRRFTAADAAGAHRPHPTGRICVHRGRSRRGTVASVAPPLRHPQSVLAPKPLVLIVIHLSGFTVDIAIYGAGSRGGDDRERSRARSAAFGSFGMAGAGSWRCVRRCCPVSGRANRSLTRSTRWRWRKNARQR